MKDALLDLISCIKVDSYSNFRIYSCTITNLCIRVIVSKVESLYDSLGE